MLKLHFAPDTCSLASLIALEEVGAKYALNRIDFSSDEQRSAAYLGINAKGRVPALETPQGILTETPAILIYIAQHFNVGNLAPVQDPFAFAEIQAFNSYLCSTLHVAHAHRMRGHRWADDTSAITAMQNKVPEVVGACYDYIESHYSLSPWVMGSKFTVADPYLFTVAQWIEGDGVDVRRIPKVMAHRSRMLERKSVQDALAVEKAT